MEEAKLVSIVIADEHPIFREGLRELLNAQDQFRVTGEAAHGEEAVRTSRRLKPAILLLDLSLPRLDGLAVLRELKQRLHEIYPILLIGALDLAQIEAALKLGARGIVLKESAPELLVGAIRAVFTGQYWVANSGITGFAEALRHLKCLSSNQTHRRYRLTPREVEVVVAVVAGESHKSIARDLSISEQTVKRHVGSIFDKLGVGSRLELGLFAVHHGLIGRYGQDA